MTVYPANLGEVLTIVVTGNTGTVGSCACIAFSPASSSAWDAASYKFIGNNITMTGGTTGTYTNTLYLTGLGSSASDYVVTFFFQVTSVASIATSPIIDVSSGTQIKFTLTGLTLIT